MTTSIWATMKPIRAWERVDASLFRTEIEPLNEPAVLRGLVAHWPAVAKARESTQALADYLQRHATATPIETFVADADTRGRFFYREDLQGLNFAKQALPLQAILAFLLRELGNVHPPALYAGGVSVPTHLPGLLAEHRLDLIDPAIERQTSVWIGNRTRVAAHWDQPQNVACVIGGRRRFTLFPIQQARNLYFGPLDRTPAGQPISLVDFLEPDYARHPKFREALEHGSCAELGPGDALYIPSLWVHHAESLDPFGLMMNFWWRSAAPYMLSPFLTMLHGLLTVRDLPPAERDGWRALFDLYVFETDGDPMAHIPMPARGLFAAMTEPRAALVAAQLRQSLAPRGPARPPVAASPAQPAAAPRSAGRPPQPGDRR